MSTTNNNFKRTLTAAAITVALGFGSAGVYAASNTDGAIAGQVTGEASSMLSGVSITITNEETGITRTLTTDAQGRFQLPRLPIGEYTVSATKAGYDKHETSDVRVSIGSKSNLNIALNPEGQVVTIVGSAVQTLDTTSSETALNLSEIELDRLPVARNITGVAMLAPGTTLGDTAFGNLASFGGSTVGENIYYINGLNLTNVRNGLGGSTVPFEFYKEFQVKTGGYSAEFGRSTGGVINAVTKSGTNEYKFAAKAFWSPDGTSENNPNRYDNEGNLLVWNEDDFFDSKNYIFEASGPIIEDELFFYAMYNPRNVKSNFAISAGEAWRKSASDDAFWGLKVDWNISPDHIVELTAFSDERETISTDWDYDRTTATVTARDGEIVPAIASRGGMNAIVKYTGYWTEDLTMSFSYGISEFDRTNGSPKDGNFGCFDNVTQERCGDWATSQIGLSEDEREAYRIDGSYYAGDHEIRFGMDYESNIATDNIIYSGDVFVTYETNNTTSVDVYRNGGEFETISNAFYVEDIWSVTDDVTLTLGLRSETFENKNGNGKTWIDQGDQIAPRLGVAWDVNGDGESRLYANYGRYHLPVATNTSIRSAGAEYFVQCDYQGTDRDASDFPILGALIGCQTFGDGIVPPTEEILDSTIDPMYQDEFIIGYAFALNDDWNMGLNFTHRDLKSTVEDVAIDAALNDFARTIGFDDDSAVSCFGIYTTNYACGFDYYVLTNPGTDMELMIDFDHDGVAETPVSLSAETLGYPESERYYNALTVDFDRPWKDGWSFSGSYVWAQSYGNNEGYVRSDNGQNDAGLTTLFDQPGLLDYGTGYLPNDRRHTLKLRGAYEVTDAITVGMSFMAQTGRPINAFGVHPTDFFAGIYGDESFFLDGEPQPRGSLGRTNTINTLDLNMVYNTEVFGSELILRADIFNVLNHQLVTEVSEQGEDRNFFYNSADDFGFFGTAKPTFMSPVAHQAGRSLRLSAEINF